MLVGAGAAFVYTKANAFMLDNKLDDVVDATAVHGASGAWGVVCVGLFAPDGGMLPELLRGKFAGGLLLTQCIGMVALGLLGLIPTYAVCRLLAKYDMLRTSEEEEVMGLDLYVFQLSAYVVRLQSPTVGSGSGGVLGSGSGGFWARARAGFGLGLGRVLGSGSGGALGSGRLWDVARWGVSLGVHVFRRSTYTTRARS